jgi:putative ABC transport system substrate-binding protein
MNRRETVAALLALGAAAGPFRVQAQPPSKVRQIGFLRIVQIAPQEDVFARELRRHGFIEGQNVVIHHRVFKAQSVLVTTGPAAAVVAKQTTRSIPIVFIAANDPVRLGLVASLARPGGNITGMSWDVTPAINGKLVEMLKEVSPKLSRLAVLWNPANPGADGLYEHTKRVAEALGLKVQSLTVREMKEYDAAFAAITKERPDGLHVFANPINITNLDRIVAFAAQNAIPAVYGLTRFTEAGGLISYGPDVLDMVRRAAFQTAKILKGEKPGDIPVEQPSKFEIAVNLKTAKALGLKIPQSILARADRVIE